MEGIPRTVLRGHERLISALCIANQDFIFSGDELGHVVVWKRKGSAPAEEEYEKISELHLEASSITSIRAEEVYDRLAVFIQVKSGTIYRYNFKNGHFIKLTDLACGTFTFCRMSSLKLFQDEDSVILLAYPSHDCESAVNILINDRKYLVKNFMIASSGMCLFAKLFRESGKIFMLCGYESGKLVLVEVDFETGASVILFEERVIDEGCTDADYFEDTIVAVGSGKEIIVVKKVSQKDCRESGRILTPFAGFNSVCIRSDGKLFVTGGWDCKLRYFSMKSLKPLAVIEHHYEAVTAVSIRKEDFVTVAASSDGTISLWTLYSGA